jgi:hypothetical protein
MYSEYYRPHRLEDIIGQESVLVQLRRWADRWNQGKPDYQSAFLYGLPGIGKSTAIDCIVNEFGWDKLEIDSADAGNDDGRQTIKSFREFIENAIYTNPYKNKCLIILEECECYKKTYYKAIEDLIEKSVNPVILTANDEFSVKQLTSYFRNNSLMLHFSPLKNYQIKMIVEKVMRIEHLQQPNLDKLIDYSHGDLRYVLNNLQQTDIVPRKETDLIFSIVHDIFRGEWNGDTQGADIDFIWYVVQQNAPNFYDTVYDEPLQEYLARIDILFSHHHRLLHQGDARAAFSLWPYITRLLRSFPLHQKTAKIEIHKAEFKFNKPEKLKAFAEDMHCSQHKAMTEFPDKLRRLWKPIEKEITISFQPKKEGDIFTYLSAVDSPVME